MQQVKRQETSTLIKTTDMGSRTANIILIPISNMQEEITNSSKTKTIILVMEQDNTTTTSLPLKDIM
jgi:hypothetical protein